MLTVNYITRPYFNDISLELIQELKKKCILNVIIIVSTWNIDYLEIKDDSIKGFGKPFELTDAIKEKILSRYHSYFEGANIILRYEQPKERSFKNTSSWMKLLSAHSEILRADLTILESLSLIADWYLFFKIRKEKIYYILHDPVPHSGENRRWEKVMVETFYKHIDKFVLYSSFSTQLFNSHFPQFAGKTITLQTPIYHNLKLAVKVEASPYKKKVLFFGRISPYKGVELFYSAAEQLCNEFKDVQFIIAGKSIPNYNPPFLENNANARIQIINQFINLDMLAKLMTESSFCVLPYLDATQSGVIMTAYAYDLPVLVSDCPGLLEYCFDKANFSFKNGDVGDLVLKIRNLLLDDSVLQANKKDITLYSNGNVSANNVLTILEA